MRIGLTALVAAAAVAAAMVAPSGLAGAGPLAPVDWPQFRFDDNHTGFNPFETVLSRRNVANLDLVWQAELGGLVTFSSPAVVGDKVYLGSSDGVLWAYPSGRVRAVVLYDPVVEVHVGGSDSRLA